MNEDPRWLAVLARLRAGASLRKVAAEFGTNPRRLRRALARAGIRVRGESLGRDGVPALVRFRSRLGKEPDGAIARAAHVTPEAVQGERRRLGIAAFRPAVKVHLSAEEEEWIRGPVREPLLPARRERPEVGPVVVRKAQRDGGSVIRRVVAANPAPDAAPPPSSAPLSEPRGPRLAWGVLAFRANEPAADVRPQSFRPTLTRPLSEREEETQRFLNAPKRERTARERIIRADARPFEVQTPVASAPPAAVHVSTARKSRAPAWRAADPELLAALAREAEAEAALQTARRVAEAEAAAQLAAKREAEREAVRRDVAQRETAAREAELARAAAAKAAAEIAAAQRAEARAASLAATAAIPTTPTILVWSGPSWAVRYDRLDRAVTIHAADIVSALALAAATLPGYSVVAITAA